MHVSLAGGRIGCLLLPSVLILSAAGPAVDVNRAVWKFHIGRYSV